MFNWFFKNDPKYVINHYSQSVKVVYLILAVLGRSNNTDDCEDEFENELIKVSYIRKDFGMNSGRWYKVWIKNGDELVLVFDRHKGDNRVEIKKFKIGYWIYHLYKIKNGGLELNEVYAPNLNLGKPEEERNRLMEVE